VWKQKEVKREAEQKLHRIQREDLHPMAKINENDNETAIHLRSAKRALMLQSLLDNP
jgi:hypothetical protein